MKTALSLLVSIILISSVAFADDPCTQGKEALAKGDFISAINFLREGVKKDKKNLECTINLGIALLNADSADQAVSALIQARELDSANSKIYALMGDAYAKQGIQTAAIEQYQVAVVHDSANAGLYRKLAYAHLKLRDYPHAIGEFRKVIQLDTTDTDAYRNVGHMYYRGKEYEKSAQYLKVVYERNSKDSSRNEFAHALYLSKYYKEFIPVAELITKEDPTQVELARWLPTAYLAIGDKEKVKQTFDPSHVDTTKFKAKDWIEQAKLFKSLDEVDPAIHSYERGLQTDSSYSKDVAYDLGSLYMKAKVYDKAVEMFNKKIALDTALGYRFASHLNAAMSLMQLKNWEDARQHVLASIELKPEFVVAWKTLAQCYAQMDSTQASRNAYKKMVELIVNGKEEDKAKYSNDLEEGYRTEGFYLLVDKKYPSSIEMFKKALAINPADCQTLLWMAQAYTLSNLRDDAKKYYCKVLNNKCDAKFDADATKGLAALGLTAADCGK